MHIGRWTGAMTQSLVATLIVTAAATPGLAQSHDHPAMVAAAPHKPTDQENALVKAVRDATERFKNVTSISGPGEGYELAFGCVSGGDYGAMGLHYVNSSILGDGEVDVTQPEIVLFEPTPNGGIRLTGADFVVFAADWDAKHSGPPQLMGQLFHFFESPNRFGLPPFYTLHVWAWKDNPNGAFVNWHPQVSCESFAGQNN